MPVTPDNVATLGRGLDHPESVCVAADGAVYAGGVAGQVYRIGRDGVTVQMAEAGGFLLGLALDGKGRLHACDMTGRRVILIDSEGSVSLRSTGAPQRPYTLPNYPVFDAVGNLYVSDSGDYWSARGTGAVLVIRPDAVFIGHASGRVELLLEDLTAELLMRPTNAALHDDKLCLANLGGWHLGVVQTNLRPGPIHHPCCERRV